MTDKAFHIFETSLGWMGVVWTKSGICRFFLGEESEAAVRERIAAASPSAKQEIPAGPLADIEDRVRSYADGEAVELDDLPVDLAEVGFSDRCIYERLRRVARGQVMTYGEMARETDAPSGARGVGQAMARNPVPLIIPCHRVVGADGRLVGFAAHGGVEAKARMLAMEGAAASPNAAQASFAF